ncbi:MAG: hypothetical protein LUH04_03110, partial [Clostridium sp.]|nr:hypothetical protein [Clostridium sp.]
YMTYDFKMNDAEIFQILRRMKELGGVTAFHCENHEIVEYWRRTYRENGDTQPIYHAKSRPNLAEAEAVARVLNLARLAGDAPVYIVHLSCKESLEAVRDARRKGQKNIFVETCPQYLTLTEEKYLEPDGLKYIMSPPLRTAEDCDRRGGADLPAVLRGRDERPHHRQPLCGDDVHQSGPNLRAVPAEGYFAAGIGRGSGDP